MLTKQKINYPVSYEEAYKHLRVDFGDDDELINRLIKAATSLAENYIEKDISKTLNTYTVYDYYGDTIRIDEGNFLSVVSVVGDDEEIFANYTVKVYANYFLIELGESVKADTLTVKFYAGFEDDECNEDIKAAILIKLGELYDIDRSGYTMGSYKATGAFEAILNYHKPLRFR